MNRHTGCCSIGSSSEDDHYWTVMNNFTPRAQQILVLARKEVDRLNHSRIHANHILLGLFRLGQGTAFNVLLKLEVDVGKVQKDIEAQTYDQDGPKSGIVPYTEDVKRVLVLAGKGARALNHSYVGTEHILLGLVLEGESAASRALRSAGLEVESLRLEILNELNPSSPNQVNGGISEGPHLSAITRNTSFGEAASNAIQYWERRRIVYNIVLALITSVYFLVGLPATWKSTSFNGILGCFLLAVSANVLFCLAYLPDILVQMSIYGVIWKRRREVLFIIGLTVASILARWTALSMFGLVPK